MYHSLYFTNCVVLLNMEVQVANNNNHEIKPIENNITKSNLDESLKKIIKKEGFLQYEIEKRCISSNGGNYLGTLFEVDVKGTTKEGDKVLNIFVKQVIPLEMLPLFSMSDVYNNELFAYKELAKHFTELQDEAGVPTDERYKMVKAYDESSTDAIIMENVTKYGFTTGNRMDVISFKFAEKSIMHLAKFHALSIALKEKRPAFFEKVLPLKYPAALNDDWQEFVKISKGVTMSQVDVEYKDKIEKLYENLLDKFVQYYSDETIKLGLCHGDYKPNNIMVRRDMGEIQEVISVDYQFIYYSCPIFDFLYLMYTGADRDFRKAHMNNLKELYYETLSNFLKYFNLSTDVLFPRKEFEKVYKEKLDYGLMITMLYLPYILAAENHVPDLAKDQSDLSFQVDDRFKDRFRGVIEEFIEWGYI